MMKKKSLILAALIIGIYGFPIEAAVPAGSGLGADYISMGKGTPSGNALDSKDIESRKEDGTDSGEAETDSLRIPLETTVIIDPWEIDGRGQVYSERYVIQNAGTEAGTLVLFNLTCISEGQDEAAVKTDKAGLHRGREKAVYVEMVFENGDKMIFGQEDPGYEVKLEPEDKLVFWFAGEVNENASQPWRDGDITVTMECAWKTEEMVLETDNGIAGTVSGQMMDKDREQAGDPERDKSTDAAEDADAGESGEGETALEPEGNKNGQQAAVDADDSAELVTETEPVGSIP